MHSAWLKACFPIEIAARDIKISYICADFSRQALGSKYCGLMKCDNPMFENECCANIQPDTEKTFLIL
jgi:hypothetical protein